MKKVSETERNWRKELKKVTHTARGSYKNRHEAFICSIFVDISEKEEVKKNDELTAALDKLLSRIFDEDG